MTTGLNFRGSNLETINGEISGNFTLIANGVIEIENKKQKVLIAIDNDLVGERTYVLLDNAYNCFHIEYTA